MWLLLELLHDIQLLWQSRDLFIEGNYQVQVYEK